MEHINKRVGLVGGRGHTGRELLALLAGHPHMELAFASSRELAGQPLAAHSKYADSDLCFENIGAEELSSRDMDACILALPNGLAGEYVAAFDEHHAKCVVLDLSADYRFDSHWHYGLPELMRDEAPGKTRISNPGCYATAMQLAIAPAVELLCGPPSCFGVSGYSGAGTRPSQRNDPAVLADNLLPYMPVGHVHEREVSYRLGRAVQFVPHVAGFFRGISMTVMLPLTSPVSRKELSARYREWFGAEPLLRLSDEIPRVADNSGQHHATVGGWQVSDDGGHAVVFATLDNLLKGAATQALQNLNLAFGFPEQEGIPHG